MKNLNISSLKYPKFFISMLEKMLSTYTHQINLRKTLPLFLLPTVLSIKLNQLD